MSVLGLEYIINIKEKKHPFFIGVSGSAGLGKTTYCKKLVSALIEKKITTSYFPLDGYLLSREKREKENICGYNPRASNIKSICKSFDTLLLGKSIKVPVYEHAIGDIGKFININNSSIIIVDGNMSIYSPIRKRYIDFHIFFDSTEKIKKNLRFEEDYNKRGYSYKQAITLYELEQDDYHKYIESQKELSDMFILVSQKRKLSLKI